eukprot:901900-Pelagomonas_calceolata.AAC.1
MNVPILRRDPNRANVCGSAWDRAHKDSIRATSVSGRGASTIRENPVWNCSGDILRDFLYPAPGVSHCGRHPYQ